MDEPSGKAPEPFEPGWRDRLWTIGAAAGRLLSTRSAILQEELSEKGEHLRAGLLGVLVALLFGTIAGLLLTALVAAILAKLFDSVVLGILVTLVLDLAVAGGAGFLAVKRFGRLRPFEFPATRREIDRDLDAIREAVGVGQREPREGEAGDGGRPAPPESAEEIEARLREGAG
jgi:uncharacterized membrane protein YqjE